MPVLIVDDIHVNRLTLTRAIRPFPVVEAGNAAEAFERVVRDEPEVIILDLGLPKIDGATLLQLIRMRDQQTGRTTPVVVVTGEGTPERVREVAALEIQGFFVKPIDPKALHAKVHALWPQGEAE